MSASGKFTELERAVARARAGIDAIARADATYQYLVRDGIYAIWIGQQSGSGQLKPHEQRTIDRAKEFVANSIKGEASLILAEQREKALADIRAARAELLTLVVHAAADLTAVLKSLEGIVE